MNLCFNPFRFHPWTFLHSCHCINSSFAFSVATPAEVPQVLLLLLRSRLPLACVGAPTLYWSSAAAPLAVPQDETMWQPDPKWDCSAGGRISTGWAWPGLHNQSCTWRILDPHPLVVKTQKSSINSFALVASRPKLELCKCLLLKKSKKQEVWIEKPTEARKYVWRWPTVGGRLPTIIEGGVSQIGPSLHWHDHHQSSPRHWLWIPLHPSSFSSFTPFISAQSSTQ